MRYCKAQNINQLQIRLDRFGKFANSHYGRQGAGNWAPKAAPVFNVAQKLLNYCQGKQHERVREGKGNPAAPQKDGETPPNFKGKKNKKHYLITSLMLMLSIVKNQGGP